MDSAARGRREYDVEITCREHWLARVVASSPAMAREKVRLGQSEFETQCGDRTITGMRVRLADVVEARQDAR